MLRWDATTMGEISIVQDNDFKFVYQLRTGNCLAVAIAKFKNDDCKKGEYVYQFTGLFYADEQHIRNIVKDNEDPLCLCATQKVTGIKLNLYYKECNTLLKYFTKYGYKVTCYYEEPKWAKKTDKTKKTKKTTK